MANVDRIFFNSNHMKSISKTAQMYIKEQSFLIEDFKEIFDNLSSYYKTDNTSKINEITYNLIDSMSQINKNFENDIILFDKVDMKYKETNEEVNEMFRRISNFDNK